MLGMQRNYDQTKKRIMSSGTGEWHSFRVGFPELGDHLYYQHPGVGAVSPFLEEEEEAGPAGVRNFLEV